MVNEPDELLNIQITPGNTDDRKPVEDVLKALYGKVFADRGLCLESAGKTAI
ncbi:MAG: transposase [Leptolyngbyaceae cyanobacterium]